MSEQSNYLSSKLRKAIKDSPYSDAVLIGIYNTIEGMSDDELKEYIYTNRQYLKQNIPAVVNDLPQLKTLVNVEPNWGVKPDSYSKLFGNEDVSEEDFLRNFDQIPYDQIEYVAQTKGLNPKTLEKDIRAKQLEQSRKDIAEGYGEDLGGKVAAKIANIVAPNVVEGAVKEGRDPTVSELSQDIGTNLVYAIPWTRVTRAATPLARLGANAIAPSTQELLNEALAEGKDNKTAGEHAGNVAIGTAINTLTPWALKRYGGRTARLLGGESGAASKAATKAGLQTADDVVEATIAKENKALNEFNKAYDKYAKNNFNDRNLKASERDLIKKPENLDIFGYGMEGTPMYHQAQVARQPGKTFNEKIAKAPKETREWFNRLTQESQDEFVDNTYDDFRAAFETPSVPMAREIIGGYATNKTGDLLYADNPTSIPFGVGRAINAAGLVESKKEKEQKANKARREKSKKEAEKKYKGKYTRQALEGK